MWWKNTNRGGKKAIKKRNAKIQQSVPSCVSTVEVLNLSQVLIFFAAITLAALLGTL